MNFQGGLLIGLLGGIILNFIIFTHLTWEIVEAILERKVEIVLKQIRKDEGEDAGPNYRA